MEVRGAAGRRVRACGRRHRLLGERCWHGLSNAPLATKSQEPKGSKYHYSSYLIPQSIYYTVTCTLWGVLLAVAIVVVLVGNELWDPRNKFHGQQHMDPGVDIVEIW